MSDKHDTLLIQLILMFQGAALQQMGKLKNPITDKIELDLEQAHVSIDMLEMLQHKMKGNLTEDEERLFISIVRDLKLNYVDETSKIQTQNNPESKP